MSAIIKLSSPETHQFWEIPVLYEDDSLLALDKPSGLLTSPDRCAADQPSLLKLLHAAIALHKPWAESHHVGYLMNAHRIDPDMSGAILFAKTKSAMVALANLFGSDRPFQQYVALVQGEPDADQFDVDEPLAPHPTKARLMRVDPRRGKRSRTTLVVRERFTRWTLLTCLPQTNRLHQVRAHLRHVGLPIVADRLYGGRPLMLSRLKRDYQVKPDQDERPLIGRVALHVEQISLPHPVTGQPLALAAPWPKDLSVAVKYLRRYAPAVSPGNAS